MCAAWSSAPTLIYGTGHGPHKESIQVPKLIDLARKSDVPRHVGRGLNIWSNVHIDDLVDLYVLAIEKAKPGSFFYAENGEASMKALAEAISRLLGFGGRTVAIALEDAIAEWGGIAAAFTFGSNSRVRARRARTDLGWRPHRIGLLEDVEHGSYRATGIRSSAWNLAEACGGGIEIPKEYRRITPARPRSPVRSARRSARCPRPRDGCRPAD